MSNQIHLTVKLEEENLRSFQKHAGKRLVKNLSTTKKLFRFFAIFSIFAAIGFYSSYQTEINIPYFGNIGFLFLFAFILLRLYSFVLYRKNGFMPGKDSDFWSQKTLIINSSGLQAIATNSNSESDWSAFDAIEQDEHCIYLILHNLSGYIIPKSQVQNCNDLYKNICNFFNNHTENNTPNIIDESHDQDTTTDTYSSKKEESQALQSHINGKHVLLYTLKATIRSLFFRPVNFHNINITSDAFVGISLFMAFFLVMFPIYDKLPSPSFSYYNLETHLAFFLLALLISYLSVKTLQRYNADNIAIIDSKYIVLVFFSIIIFSQIIDSLVTDNLKYDSEYFEIKYWIFLLWPCLAIVVSIFRIAKRKLVSVIASLLLFIFYFTLPSYYFTEGLWPVWYVESKEVKSDSDGHTNNSYWDKAKESINQESIYYSQFDLLQSNKNNLIPGTAGITDLYYIGFDSYATQDVFYKEGQYVQNLFDDDFGTDGRSIRLSNNLKSIENVPMANSENLRKSLQQVSNVMNIEEDIAFLFMTSHGAKNHEFSVKMWPLKLNDITPENLKQYLDDSGIKWRIIVVSACYSGGFIEPLKDEHTLIATASAADRNSYGCSHKNDFTHYGRVLFHDLLAQNKSFLDSFEKAPEIIAEDENKEKRKHSLPQLFIGSKMKEKLEAFEMENTEARIQVNGVADN